MLSVLCLIVLYAFPIQVFSADDVNPTKAELDQMLAPIALYPDSLLSQIFMASTYPANVAEAVQWSKDNPDQKGDAAVEAVNSKSWDPSVMSLVAFPQVLDMMGKQPDWVQTLGDTFLAKPDVVMDTVQVLRKKAKDEGNLESTKEQTVTVEPASVPEQTTQTTVIQQSSPEIIVIEPADPQIIYVPTYNPTIVYGTWGYPSYPPYYYQPVGWGYSPIMRGIGFGVGLAITNSLWGNCNWGRGDVDINVNRYNNINSNNNRLSSNRKNSNWSHNRNNRRTPYKDGGSRSKYSNKMGGSDGRQNFRGRDTASTSRNADRQRAQESLKKRGNDPAAARNKLSGAGGDKVRSQVNKADRSRAGNSNLRNSSQSRNIGQSRNMGQSRDKMKSANRSTSPIQNRPKSSSQNRSRSSSLSGIGNQSRSSNNFNRGSRSVSRSGGGGARSGGVGGRRGGGGR